MKQIDLDVLAYEGPMLRAYLAVLYFSGYKPRKIFCLIPDKDRTGKPLARFMPSFFRPKHLKKKQDFQNNYWVRILSRKYLDSVLDVIRICGQTAELPESITEGMLQFMTSRNPFVPFQTEVIDIYASGLQDPLFAGQLAACKPKVVLFTGGGLVPESVLKIKNLKILHIHPGFLPHVRGADGLLWSVLVRKKPGITAFYMEPGLDTGDIVYKREFSIPQFHHLPDLDIKNFYRLLYAFVDPIFRAKGLSDVIQTAIAHNDNFDDLPVTKQAEEDGVTYHFMHPWLQEKVFTYFGRTPYTT